MSVFTLVNSASDGGYFMAPSRTSMGWRGLPRDLAREMEDVRRKGEEVEDVSIGLDGDWFLRTNARHSCKTEFDSVNMASNVELFVQLLQNAGLSLDQYAIQFFNFMPDPTGYVTVLHKTDGSLTRCLWHNVPRELDIALEREGANGVRHVAVGKNGAYVVLLNTGVVWWAGVPDALHRLLDDAEKRRRRVATVSLSLISDRWYFIEFADGATKFFLPPVWHDSINKITAQAARVQVPKISTSYSRGPSPSPSPLRRAPQHHAQFGSFNPADLHSRPNPSYPPVVANPYPLPILTGMPPQPPPVYNFTNVYNNPIPQLPQQQQQPLTLQDYNGSHTILGGIMKIAGGALNRMNSTPTFPGTGGFDPGSILGLTPTSFPGTGGFDPGTILGLTPTFPDTSGIDLGTVFGGF